MEPLGSRLYISVWTCIETELAGAQLAKKREYSFGAVIGKDWLKEEDCGENSWNLKRGKMYWEERTQKLGLNWDSWMTWRRDSGERRKNPKREGRAEEDEENDTEETETATWPVWVKPNFSKRIMGRESEEMVTDLISPRTRVEKGRRRRRRRWWRAVLPILCL